MVNLRHAPQWWAARINSLACPMHQSCGEGTTLLAATFSTFTVSVVNTMSLLVACPSSSQVLITSLDPSAGQVREAGHVCATIAQTGSTGLCQPHTERGHHVVDRSIGNAQACAASRAATCVCVGFYCLCITFPLSILHLHHTGASLSGRGDHEVQGQRGWDRHR
jgi:hypothetical protein